MTCVDNSTYELIRLSYAIHRVYGGKPLTFRVGLNTLLNKKAGTNFIAFHVPYSPRFFLTASGACTMCS